MIKTTKIIGTMLTTRSEFTDITGALVDPTEVLLRYKKPTGNIANVTATQTANGKYEAAVLLDTAGEWYFRWEGTGPSASASEFSISVTDTNVK